MKKLHDSRCRKIYISGMASQNPKCQKCRKQIKLPGRCYSCATGRPREVLPNAAISRAFDWLGKERLTRFGSDARPAQALPQEKQQC